MILDIFRHESATSHHFDEILKSKLRELELQLVQLPEQKIILLKIESISSQIDAGKENLRV